VRTFIFGASGFAKEVEWMIYEINKKGKEKIHLENFVVGDNDYIIGKKVNGIEVISESIYFSKYHRIEKHNCYIAVGSPVIRKKIADKISSENTLFPNLIHSSVIYDDRYTNFGKGIIICPGVNITTNVLIQDFAQINQDVTIGHDTIIQKFTTISPGANISGNVNLNCSTFIGAGVTILENISIIDNAIIGAGSLVTKSIFENGTYVGIPAKKIK
jgi:sugar O-acyltransferase (sialic acid O-acetyltransferase NeuD family)